MKIHVNRIPAEGLHEQSVYDPAVLDLDWLDIRVAQPITVDVSITKTERAIMVQAQLEGVLELTFGLCLATANQFLVHAIREARPEDGLLSEEMKDDGTRLA